jgi:N-ethylmaleimide reductase
MGAPLNNYDRSTFYGGDERGYTDYSFFGETAAHTAAITLAATAGI